MPTFRLHPITGAVWVGFAVVATLSMAASDVRPSSETFRRDPVFVEPLLVEGSMCPNFKFGDEVLACSRDQNIGVLEVASEAIWPLDGPVTSAFGYRRSPFSHRPGDFHPGIDIAARRGVPILAAADGIVTFAGVRSGYGRSVVIDHGFGMSSIYGHASRIFVREGLWVEKGTVIGLVGSSGASTGPHLHYESRLGSVPVDPRSLYQGGVL